MTKEEVMCATLKQLSDSLSTSSERFKLEDPEIGGECTFPGPTIIWKFEVEVNGHCIQDPNNAPRTIVITYNSMGRTLSCAIYMRDVSSYSSTSPDAIIKVHYDIWCYFYKSYWRFMKLRKRLIDIHRNKTNLLFLKKLNAIFPTALDENFLE
jgi:hypothetical protein